MCLQCRPGDSRWRPHGARFLLGDCHDRASRPTNSFLLLGAKARLRCTTSCSDRRRPKTCHLLQAKLSPGSIHRGVAVVPGVGDRRPLCECVQYVAVGHLCDRLRLVGAGPRRNICTVAGVVAVTVDRCMQAVGLSGTVAAGILNSGSIVLGRVATGVVSMFVHACRTSCVHLENTPNPAHVGQNGFGWASLARVHAAAFCCLSRRVSRPFGGWFATRPPQAINDPAEYSRQSVSYRPRGRRTVQRTYTG